MPCQSSFVETHTPNKMYNEKCMLYYWCIIRQKVHWVVLCWYLDIAGNVLVEERQNGLVDGAVGDDDLSL